MKSICLAVSDKDKNNKIFTSDRNWIYNFKKDDGNIGFSLLKKELDKIGIFIGTQDFFKNKTPDLCMHLATPKKIKGKINYFLLPEHDLIVPGNKKIINSNFYDKVFCQFDKLIDNERIFKLNYPFSIKPKLDKDFEKRTLLTSMIASNKSCKLVSKKILYQKRYEIIKWFEQNNKSSFELYGNDWNLPPKKNGLRGRITNFLNRKLNKSSRLKTYKGIVKRKSEVLLKSKFTFCIENVNENGYISDIIFDAYNNGCIPIYLGPDNINQYFSKNSFIDLKDFQSYEDLFDYLVRFKIDDYCRFHENFALNQDLINNNFSNKIFVQNIVNYILRDLKKTN